MSLSLSKKKIQHYLPKALEGQSGKVDVALLTGLWSSIPKSASVARKLAKDIGGVSLKPTEQPYETLAELIADPVIFNSWCNQSKYPTFRQLVFAFVEKNVHCLSIPELRRIGFLLPFTGTKNSSVPNVEQITALIEGIRRSTDDERYISLGIWSLIDNANNARAKHPKEKRFQNLKEVIYGSLLEAGLDSIVKLSEKGEWISQLSRQGGSESISEKVRVVKRGPKPHENNSNSKFHPIKDQIIARVSLLEEKQAKYLSVSAALSSKAKSFNSELDPRSSFKIMREQIGSLETIYHEIRGEFESILTKIYNSVNECMASIGMSVVQSESPVVIPSNKKSLDFLTEKIRWTERIFQIVEKFDQPELVAKVCGQEGLESIACPENSLIKTLQSISVKVECLSRGIAVESRFIALIEKNLGDISWNIFRDENVSSDMWDALGDYYIATESVGPRLGIITQHRFNLLSGRFGELLAQHLQLKKKLVCINCISALSWLSLGQQTRLSEEHAELRTAVALNQVDAYLIALDCGRDPYIYWSMAPLADVNHTTLSQPARDFFKSIFDLLYKSPLNSQTLQNCVSAALLSSAGSQDQTSPKELFINELKDILAFRKKGGKTTYAHIWQAAYEEIVAPLLHILNSQGVETFIEYFRNWFAKFSVDNHKDEWKSEIPEHLKKNSEYDKFIRNQVSLKIAEIENWIDIYTSISQHIKTTSNDSLLHLKRAIQGVFKASDIDSFLISQWLEQKLTIGGDKFNKYICHDLDLSGIEFQEQSQNQIDARHPRAFRKSLTEPVALDLVYTDDLIETFGFLTTTSILESYAKNEVFEGYTLIASQTSDEILPSLDRTVEKRIEEIDLDLRRRASELEGAVAADAHFFNVLDSARACIENQQWILADKWMLDAELIAKELISSEQLKSEKERIIAQIDRYGGHPNASLGSSIEELSEILADLLKVNEARRAHILILEKLYDLDSSGFEEQLHECLRRLDRVDRFPSPAVSDQLAYYFEQAVLPLCNELKRSRTLLPTYAMQLKNLGRILLLNIQQEDQLLNETSPVISILIDTAELWQQLSAEGKPMVDRIIEVFTTRGLPLAHRTFHQDGSISHDKKAPDHSHSHEPIKSEFEILVSKALLESAQVDNITTVQELSNLLATRNWREIAAYSLVRLKNSNFKSQEDLANWAVSFAFSNLEGVEQGELAAIIRLINRKFECPVIRFVQKDKVSRAKTGELVSRLIRSMASTSELINVAHSELQILQDLTGNISTTRSYQDVFRYAFDLNLTENIAIKAYWDSFSGEQKQAETRALLIYLCWTLYASQCLAYCLTLSPIELERRKADALAKVANDSLVSGNYDLLQGFLDLRKNIQAKPFQIFVDLAYRFAMPQSENPAKLNLLGGLDRNKNGMLASVILIEPRRADSPDKIILKLPNNCPVLFADGGYLKELSGPFFTETSLPIGFTLIDESAVNFNVEVECSAVSLTGDQSKFSQRLSFSINDDVEFSPLAPDDIDDAFNNFPDAHMRGESYVPRVSDEQKIEKALFRSKTVRSIWISSPRRSGKTTMLYRILDAYSHKVGRDNIVVYLTLDESFESISSFNKWLWRRLRLIAPNKELRDLYSDFESLGRDLPFDSDSGTFLGVLSDRLLKYKSEGTRVIYLIDEIDRFASMYFEGGNKKAIANDILWQIRHAINDRRDIGIVFAGSSAAKQIFIVNAESPFYNSIDHLELTPFGVKTKQMEDASRQIVEPIRIRSKYNLQKDSLEHLIWICAGIPYYMKLIAGATYSTAKQSHILRSDINEGLRALLHKETGISKLDDMGGDPGSDDLRTTIAIEKRSDSVIAKAVLFALAELYSPLSGHRPYRGKIASDESRLVFQYKIPKHRIERGLEICIGLGLIRMIETESTPEIEFAIPLLGESLRKSSGRYWAVIDHELSNLALEEQQ